MAAGSKWSIVRVYALVFGIAYLGVTAVELILGSSGYKVGSQLILKATPEQTTIHALVGLAVLGSFFAGDAVAKLVARAVGIVFVAVSALGIFARTFTGKLLGFHGPLPWSYNAVHLLTMAAALFAGFAVEKAYGQRAAGPSPRQSLAS